MTTVYYNATGATLTPLGVRLTQRNSKGKLVPVDLDGLTVQVEVRNAQGNVVVAETTTGVTVVAAADGEVSYDLTPLTGGGEFFPFFHVYGAGGKYDVFPVPLPEENRLRVVIAQKV
jgi:hypothetical protein